MWGATILRQVYIVWVDDLFLAKEEVGGGRLNCV
jgi:hypothetical protein